MLDQQHIEEMLRQVMPCNECFARGHGPQRSRVDTSQPRPVGARYATSNLRVALVTLNPAKGTSSAHAPDNERFRELLHSFRDGGSFEPVAEHTHRGLRTNWFGGHFKTLYLDEFGLDLDEIALANIAWCATADGRESDLWRPCLKRNTARLLAALKPDVVLLAGGEAGKFAKDVRGACPWAEVGLVPHCSYLRYLHGQEKKRLWIATAKAEFDAIMTRGRSKRSSRGGPVPG